jgi:hypothetical protein
MGLAVLVYMQMVFVRQRTHMYGSPRPVTGVVLLFISLDSINRLRFVSEMHCALSNAGCKWANEFDTRRNGAYMLLVSTNLPYTSTFFVFLLLKILSTKLRHSRKG